MVATEKKYTLDELKLGMPVSKDQLSEIYDVYMLIVYSKPGDKIGSLEYFSKETNDTYAKIMTSGKPMCPIYNLKEEAEELYSYDE